MTSPSSRFEGLLDRYFESVLEDHPVLATTSGLQSGEGKLGRTDAAFLKRQEKRRRMVLAELDQISPRELSSEQHLDRLALRSDLLRECEDYARARFRMDPGAVDTVLNILLHELMRGEEDRQRSARNIRSLLREAPRYLTQASRLIDRPEPVWRRILEQTCDGVGDLLAALQAFLVKVGRRPSDDACIASVRLAVERYRDRVMGLQAASPGSFAVGPEILARRVKDQLGLDYTLGEIEALALDEANRIGELLHRACRRFGKNRSAEQIIDEGRTQWDPGEDLLETYKKETRRVASAFRKAKAVSIPKNQTLEVRAVPDFMRPLFPTAAYSAPGAFEKRQRGIFWVNDLSVTKSSEAEKQAERAQHFGLSLTCAHEAYPGHHLQFATANQHPRRWRRLFAHAIFYEGWTLWCEQMTVDLEIEASPWLKIQQLHDALWRVHRILVDLRLQTKRYSYQQAVRHMQTHLGFTKARAQADVNWYTGAPTVPMSYWLGRLENERLRQRLMMGRGWSLKRFNDWLLSFGTLPQAWIEKYGLD